MRITISKAELVRLLAGTTKVVEGRNTIPILAMVRLVATKDKLTVTATDLDIAVSASADCAATPGATCVDAKLFAGIVNKAPGDLTLSVEKDILHVTSGKSKFKVPTLPAADFPDMTVGGFDVEFTTDLAALFAPVMFAISTEETRYYLNGIYLHPAGDDLIAVATDGHRLSRNSTAGSAEFKGVIVPRKTVGLVPKGDVTLAVSETKIRITKDDLVLVSKVIDGTFPDYQRVIPTGNDKVVKVDNATMRAAVDRVSIVSSERGRAVKLTIADGTIDLAVRGDGEASDTVAVAYEGDPVEIGFNAAYLGECLANLPAGDVELVLADGGSPALMRVGATSESLLVLMPTRI